MSSDCQECNVFKDGVACFDTCDIVRDRLLYLHKKEKKFKKALRNLQRNLVGFRENLTCDLYKAELNVNINLIMKTLGKDLRRSNEHQ